MSISVKTERGERPAVKQNKNGYRKGGLVKTMKAGPKAFTEEDGLPLKGKQMPTAMPPMKRGGSVKAKKGC